MNRARTWEMRRAIWDAWQHGITMKRIAEIMEISQSRVDQIIRKFERDLILMWEIEWPIIDDKSWPHGQAHVNGIPVKLTSNARWYKAFSEGYRDG